MFLKYFLRTTLTILVFLALASLNQALVLDCTYARANRWKITNMYSCIAKVLFIGDDRIVTNVSSNHLAGYTNNDVQHFAIDNHASMVYPPRDIHLFFPNLISIGMTNNGFTEISKEDLKGLTQLKQITLNLNKIQEVPADLFIDNPSMIAISFHQNKIRHVAHNVFDHLRELKSVEFASNTCHSQNVNENRAAVELLIFNLKRNCPATIEMTEARILSSFEFRSQANRTAELEERMRRLEHRLEILESGASNF